MFLICLVFLVGCNGKSENSILFPTGDSSAGQGATSTSEQEGQAKTEYTVRFTLSVEMDGNTLYLSVSGLSVPNEEMPRLHTIEPKTVAQGEALDFLKTPTILNDQSSRYVFVRWEATDGATAVTVTENTVLSETALKCGAVTVYPVLKKVAHTSNYS